jgi:hypothetical protein
MPLFVFLFLLLFGRRGEVSRGHWGESTLGGAPSGGGVPALPQLLLSLAVGWLLVVVVISLEGKE